MSFLSNLPLYLLSLPIALLALSVHETAHGYVAYKLGDPTAHSLGRLTLNPAKHIDPIGFICMVIFHIGWAKPVPINTRYFKNPKRGMALSAAAGPVSNLLLALIFALLLRLEVLLVDSFMQEELVNLALATNGAAIAVSGAAKFLSVLAYMLFIGVILNTSLAIFNLIPVPPFDGSRIFYAFLPPKWYFGVMKYERYIMMGCIILFFALSYMGLNPLGTLEDMITNGLFSITGMGSGTLELGLFNYLLGHLSSLVYAA